MAVEPLFQELATRLCQHPGRPLDWSGVPLREAAVMVPLRVHAGTPSVLLTRRPETMRRHGGEISFPGGVRDAADATPLHAALRELEEELGVRAEDVEVLGMLDEIPTSSQFRVTPFVGRILPTAVLRPNPTEIGEVLDVPLWALLQPARHRVERHFIAGADRDVFFFEYAGHTIWGVTGRILRNLVDQAAELPAWKELRQP